MAVLMRSFLAVLVGGSTPAGTWGRGYKSRSGVIAEREGSAPTLEEEVIRRGDAWTHRKDKERERGRRERRGDGRLREPDSR